MDFSLVASYNPIFIEMVDFCLSIHSFFFPYLVFSRKFKMEIVYA